MDDQKLANFLNEKHLWYMNTVVHRRAEVTEFAKWLHVAQPSLSQWMRGVGRQPNLENLVRMAVKLGVRETFEAAGMGEFYQKLLESVFDDPRFGMVARAWFDMDEATRDKILATVTGETRQENSHLSEATT